MILKMLIEAELFAHLNALNDAHPGTVEIATSRSGFPCLQNEEQRLDCAQSRRIHEGIGMP